MQIGSFGITNPLPTLVDAAAINQVVFEENFDSGLSGWNLTLCQATSGEQQCVLDTITSIGIPPPSSPNWGRAGVIDSPGNCIGGSIEAIFTKEFNVANEGDYTLGTTIGGSTCDICDAFAKLFLDSVLKFNKKGRNTSVDGSGPVFVSSEQATVHLTAGMHTIGIGGGVVPPGFFPFVCSGFFGGFFDEIRIEKPECTLPPSGMVSWWDGDAVTGTTARDIQDGNDGTLVNGATTALGKVGQAFSFAGLADYVNVPENSGLNLLHATIDMWIMPTMATSDLTGRHFIDKRLLGTPSTGEYTGYVRGNGDIDFIFDTTGTDPFFDGSLGLIPMGVWSHIAFTWDGSILNVYRNGIIIGTASGSGSIINNAESIKIGTRVDFNNFFKGLIDEVEIYNRALTQQEIQAIFNAGSAGKCKEFFDVEKFYTETDVNWNPNIDNDGDGLINEDPVNGVNDDNDCTDGTNIFFGTPTNFVDDACWDATNTLKAGMTELIDEDGVDEIKFGTTLPIDSGKFLLQAVLKKDGTVLNYNPGQYYAVTKVTVRQDIDNLWIEELFADCTDRDDGPNLSIVNPNKVPGGAAVIVVDPLGTVMDRSDELAASGALFLTDTNGTPNDESDDNGITDNAELHLEESIPKDSMVYLYVKFAPGLKGQPLPSDPDNMCHNEEIVSTMIDDSKIEEIAEADLIVKAK